MKHKWEIEKRDFLKSLLHELKQEKCSKEDYALAKLVISYLIMFLPLNYNPGRKLEIVPTLAGLALFTGVPKEVLEQKGKESKVFKKLYSYLYSIQEARVLALSLKNQINYRIASLVLFNRGYKAKKSEKEEPEPSAKSMELLIKFAGAEYTPPIRINPEKVSKGKRIPPPKFNNLLEKDLANIKESKNIELNVNKKKDEKAE